MRGDDVIASVDGRVIEVGLGEAVTRLDCGLVMVLLVTTGTEPPIDESTRVMCGVSP